MREEISEDQTEQLILQAAPRAQPVVEKVARGGTPPLPMPATTPLASGQHSQHYDEAPERAADSPLTSLLPSIQYLDPKTPPPSRSEAGYKDTIMPAPPAGANTATGEPAGADSTLEKTSIVFTTVGQRTDVLQRSYG